MVAEAVELVVTEAAAAVAANQERVALATAAGTALVGLEAALVAAVVATVEEAAVKAALAKADVGVVTQATIATSTKDPIHLIVARMPALLPIRREREQRSRPR